MLLINDLIKNKDLDIKIREPLNVNKIHFHT